MKMDYDDYADEPIKIKSIIDLEDNKITIYCDDHKLDHGTRDSIFGHVLTQNLYGISIKKFLVSENPEYTMEGNIDAKFSFGDDIIAYRVASFCNSALRIVMVQYDKEEDMSIFALYDVNREGSYIVYFDDKKQTGNMIYKMKDNSAVTKMHFRYYGNPLDMCWIPIEITEGEHKLLFKDDKKNMCMVKEGDDMYGIKVITKDHTISNVTFIPFIPIEVLGGTVSIFKDENFWIMDNLSNKMAVHYMLEEDEYLSSMDQMTIEVMRYIELSLLLRRDINEQSSSRS